MAGRLRRLGPPLLFFLGLSLFGLGLVAVGIEASEVDPEHLEPSALVASDGTARLAYPTKYFGYDDQRIEVAYSFPAGPGNATVLDCLGYRDLMRGQHPEPLLAFTGVAQGGFVLSDQTFPADRQYHFIEDPATGTTSFCEAVVVFEWSVPGNDPTQGQPTASVVRHTTPFDQGRYWLILVLQSVGAVMALMGGIAWAGSRGAAAVPDTDASPLEVLRASLERMGSQLERTRRLLRFAGALGVFLWYPILVPWAWRQAERTATNPLFPWAVAGITLAFLLVLTGLWVRELHHLDRELSAWRLRMGRLREREAGLLETLEQGR